MSQTAQFDYREINEFRYRPIVPVDLWVDGEIFPYEALVDSGADFCVFPCEVAEVLGIVPEEGIEIKLDGIGATSAKGYVHKINMKIDVFEYEASVVFSNALVDYSHGLLGQAGLFDEHVICFDHPNKIFTISKY
jgi:predicted aspartyl protease